MIGRTGRDQQKSVPWHPKTFSLEAKYCRCWKSEIKRDYSTDQAASVERETQLMLSSEVGKMSDMRWSSWKIITPAAYFF